MMTVVIATYIITYISSNCSKSPFAKLDFIVIGKHFIIRAE